MKNNFKLKSFMIFCMATLVALNSIAQSSYINKRWNIKAAYSRYETGTYFTFDNKYETVGNYRIETNYGLSDYFEAGLYIGYSMLDFTEVNWADTSFSTKNYFVPNYGLNLNFHVLPFLITSEDFRFDLYITGKVGGLYFTTPSNYATHGHEFEYGIGAGLTFYLWKRVGFFAEYSYGKYYFRDKDKLRYGLSVKF